MRETEADLVELQALLDRSDGAAGPHLRSIFDDRQRATASDVVATLDGVFEMHLATVTAGGAPLVAPLDGILFHGKVWFGLPAASLRARLVRRNAAVSASFTRESFAFIVHGTAHELEPGTAPATEFDALVRELYVGLYGPGWLEWHERHKRETGGDDGFNGWIEPRRMFAKC